MQSAEEEEETEEVEEEEEQQSEPQEQQEMQEEGNGDGGEQEEEEKEEAEEEEDEKEDEEAEKEEEIEVEIEVEIEEEEEEEKGEEGNSDGDGDGVDEDDDDDDEDEDAEDLDRRKQLATLMCFSSLQTLMAMELCRDISPPLEEICTENSTILPIAFLKLMLLAATSLMQEEGRQCWKLQRPGSEWTRIERGVASIDAATRDSLWRRKYSMSYACFLYVVEELRPFIQSESKIYVRAPLEIDRAVAMVLYRLAQGLSAREVAEKYNVGASTVGKYTLIVASALADANKLYGRYMAIPTGDRMVRIISQFQQMTNVSNMCGAIDGTHIKLYFKPAKLYTPSAYRSPYKFHSILLQAVCDPNKLFWDVCCMAPGGAHDASHFMTSNLYQKIKEGLSLQEPVLTVEGRDVSPYMVGDSAYPIRPFCMKPFDTDDALRRAFDEQLRKGLACIEDAFVILKTRWRILKCMNVHLMHAPQIAVACCVLHNICQLWGEPEPQQQQVETHLNNQSRGSSMIYEVDEAAKMAGEGVREVLFRDWVKRSLDNSFVSFDHENMFSGQN